MQPQIKAERISFYFPLRETEIISKENFFNWVAGKLS